MPSSNYVLTADAAVVAMFASWTLQATKFVVNTPLEEIPEKKSYIMMLMFWFVLHVCYAHIMIRGNRHRDLQESFNVNRIKLRDWLRETDIGTDVQYLLGFLRIRQVCKAGNAILECLIVGSASFFGVKACVEFFYGNDPTFCFQNFMSLILYCALEVRFRGLHNVKKLIAHFCYVCIHGGYLGECLDYEESYVAFNTGFVVSMLFVTWHVLDFPVRDGSNLGDDRSADSSPTPPSQDISVPARGEQPKKSRRDNVPVSPTSPGGSQTSPARESRRKPKQKKKKRR